MKNLFTDLFYNYHKQLVTVTIFHTNYQISHWNTQPDAFVHYYKIFLFNIKIMLRLCISFDKIRQLVKNWIILTLWYKSQFVLHIPNTHTIIYIEKSRTCITVSNEYIVISIAISVWSKITQKLLLHFLYTTAVLNIHICIGMSKWYLTWLILTINLSSSDNFDERRIIVPDFFTPRFMDLHSNCNSPEETSALFHARFLRS